MSLITAETPLGFELPPMYKQLRLDMFGANGAKTIHNDEAAAKREGLSGPIAVGPQVAANIFKLMSLCFGDGWLSGGKAEITFRKPIPSTDFLSTKGVVTGKIIDNGRTRVLCDVWVENAEGDKAVVGKCSALI